MLMSLIYASKEIQGAAVTTFEYERATVPAFHTARDHESPPERAELFCYDKAFPDSTYWPKLRNSALQTSPFTLEMLSSCFHWQA